MPFPSVSRSELANSWFRRGLFGGAIIGFVSCALYAVLNIIAKEEHLGGIDGLAGIVLTIAGTVGFAIIGGAIGILAARTRPRG